MPSEIAFARDLLARNLLPGWGLREGETVESRLAFADASREDEAHPGEEPQADGGAAWQTWCAINWYREGGGLLDEGETGREFGRFGIHGAERTFWGFWRSILGEVIGQLEKTLLEVARGGQPPRPLPCPWRGVLESDWDWQAVAAAGIDFRTRRAFPDLLAVWNALERGADAEWAADALAWLGTVREALALEVGGALARLAERGANRAQAGQRRQQGKAERKHGRDLLRKAVGQAIRDRGQSIREAAATLEITPAMVRRLYAELHRDNPKAYPLISDLRATPARDPNEGRELDCGHVTSIQRRPKTAAQFIAETKRREAAQAKAAKAGKADAPIRLYRSRHVGGLPADYAEHGPDCEPEGGWVGENDLRLD